jgi:hypothetical protein
LRDFPNSFVKSLDVVRDFFDVLDRAIVFEQEVLDVLVPKIKSNQVFDQVRVDTDKLTSEHSSVVHISCDWFERLSVAKDLRG